MSIIRIETYIKAPAERCFDLSTSIDLHKISASHSQEQAVEGITSGLIILNETVTWRAKHFGVWHMLKVKITEYDRPNYFVDEMLEGAFKHMKHKHEFKASKSGTLMIDTFEFASPFWVIGMLVDKLLLKNYMSKFIEERNKVIQEYAESDKWKKVLAFPL